MTKHGPNCGTYHTWTLPSIVKIGQLLIFLRKKGQKRTCGHKWVKSGYTSHSDQILTFITLIENFNYVHSSPKETQLLFPDFLWWSRTRVSEPRNDIWSKVHRPTLLPKRKATSEKSRQLQKSCVSFGEECMYIITLHYIIMYFQVTNKVNM